jgi:murein DD-endopeptidase MepM/ murein hydrolase activator NlpD
MVSRLRAVLAVALGASAVAGRWGGRAAQVDLRWTPERPAQGALVLLDAGAEVSGTLADEPLHFERVGDRHRALAAIPLGADDTVTATLTAGGTTFTVAIPVARRVTGTERLRTADRYTRPPDAALEARLERERAQVRAVLAATHERPRLWREAFAVPVPGRLLSGFGSARTFNATVQSRHRGADLAGASGDSVRAANRGVVVLVAVHFYAGRSVWVDHGAGLLTAYLHLSAAAVAVGDTVDRGQVLGRVGMTGRVTAPHLHWSALYGRVGFDPLDLLGPRALELLGGTAGD